MSKGILVPSYYPWWTQQGLSDYNRLVQTAVYFKHAKLLVVNNPNSGPLGPQDGWLPKRKEWCQKIIDNGGLVLHYVSTDYGNRPMAEIQADCEMYLKLYVNDINGRSQVSGFFFDETSPKAAHQTELKLLTQKLKPGLLSVLNTGIPGSYQTGELTLGVTAETKLSSWVNVDRNEFKNQVVLLHSIQGDPKMEDLYKLADKAEYLYFSPGQFPEDNVWGELHPQFETLVTLVEAAATPPEPKPPVVLPAPHDEAVELLEEIQTITAKLLALIDGVPPTSVPANV